MLLVAPTGAQENDPDGRHDCIITPYQEVDLSSPVPGVIATVTVDRGDRVTTGEAAARLDAGVEQASLALARLRASLKTEIALQEVRLEFDRSRRERLDSLHRSQAASTQDREQVERDADLTRLRLRQAHEELEQRQLELRRAEEVVEQKIIRSPIDGIVVHRYKSVGEYVEDQPIVRIVQLDPLRVEAILPMAQHGSVHPGMRAEVIPEAVDATPTEAVVTVVDAVGDAASGTYGVRLEMANPGHRLPAGLKCSVRFLGEAERTREGADSPTSTPATGAGG